MDNEYGFEIDTKQMSNTQKASAILVNQTYSYINNTMFYALAPAPYYQYYQQFIRRFAWWYDRYVPDFHSAQNGIFSTGIAHSLVDGIADFIVGSTIKLKVTEDKKDDSSARETLKKANNWAKRVNFTSICRKDIKYGGALSTALIKANVSAGEIWLEALRFDDFFFNVGFKNELQEVTCLIKSYTDTSANIRAEQQVKSQKDKSYRAETDLSKNYYLVEKRFYKHDDATNKDIPYVVYQIHQYMGSITNAQTWDPSLIRTVDWDSIPKRIRDLVIKDYSMVKIGEEQRLPFVNLGCQLIRYGDNDGSLSQQPFGQSILTNIISFLMGYDLAYSYFMRDLYQGKGIVFMAQELWTNNNPSALSGLDESLYKLVPALNDASNKLPIDKVQFDLRTQDWAEARNIIYENIASNLNISPSSIANFLSDNTARTAKEVTVESSATDNYIEIQRGILGEQFNKFLNEVVAPFYGWCDKIEIKWAKSGTANLDTLIDRIIKLKSAGLITQYDALKMYMVDADESEIEEADKRLTEYNLQHNSTNTQNTPDDELSTTDILNNPNII